MNYNLQKLKEWYKMFPESKKLSFEEAQIVSSNMLNATNETEKEYLKNELIFGTIHVLYKQLKSSYLPYFQHSQVDVEDVISTGFEIWMKFILSGGLLEIPYYGYFFDKFFVKINSSLFYTYHTFAICFDFFKLRKNELINLLIKYFLIRKNNYLFSKEQFKDIFSIDNVNNLYPFFETIFTVLNNQGFFEREETIIERQLQFLLPSLIDQYFNAPFNPKDSGNSVCRLESKNSIEEVENQVLRDRVYEISDSIPYVSERNKDIFKKYFKYNDTSLQLAEDYNIRGCRIRKITQNTCNHLKNYHTDELRNLLRELSS